MKKPNVQNLSMPKMKETNEQEQIRTFKNNKSLKKLTKISSKALDRQKSVNETLGHKCNIEKFKTFFSHVKFYQT